MQLVVVISDFWSQTSDFRQAKMIGFVGVRRNNTGQITKTVTIAQLPEHHDEQLVPACEIFALKIYI